MRLIATDKALNHVAANGGTVYLWSKETRCCGGRTAVLEVATKPGERSFERIHCEGHFEIWATKGLPVPAELHLDLGRRGALRAFWNGQAWIG